MTIYIGSDHRGYQTKNEIVELLQSKGLHVVDEGPSIYNPNDDYTDYAIKVSDKVQKNFLEDKGILICSSGVGMYMTANKFTNIFAAECRTPEEAKKDREHHGSNILVLNEESSKKETAWEIISTWLETPFQANGRHERRVKEIKLLHQTLLLNNGKLPKPEIIPAILSNRIEDYINLARRFSIFTNKTHIDIMDGKLVQSQSPDPIEILEELTKTTSINNFTHSSSNYQAHIDNQRKYELFYNLHLMVTNPMPILESLNKFSNLYLVYLHVQTITPETLDIELPFGLGLAINPDIPIQGYKEYIHKVDTILLMTVHPGKQGGDFVPEVLNKIQELRNFGYEGQIHLDGAINQNTIPTIMQKVGGNIDTLSVGSAISKATNQWQEYKRLERLV